MADDIDIEEHDILENPRIKNILPHFDIKTEPVDLDNYEYEDPSENYEDDYYETQERDDNDPEYHSYQEFSEMSPASYGRHSPDTDPSDEIYHHNNKIILGSKPCPKVSPIILGTKTCQQDPFILETRGSIVLGSKPCPKSHKPTAGTCHSYETHGYVKPCPKSKKPSILRSLLVQSDDSSEESCSKPDRVPEDAIVFLEDWGARLSNSTCYCSECETLFATRNALDAHNMIAHSFLVAMASPEAPKSPEEVKTPEDARYCNQCHTYFTDDNLLIQHLYEHLTAKTKPEVKTDKLFYKCPFCFAFYTSNIRFKHHTTQNHNTYLGNVKKVPFANKCCICDKKYTDRESHNKHIQCVHNELYKKKVKNNVDSKTSNPTASSIVKVKKFVKKPVVSSKILSKINFKKSNKGKIDKTGQPTKFFSKLLKCTKCKTFYSSRKSALAHVKNKHPGEKSIVYNNEKKIVTRVTYQKYKYYKWIVPKNVIFKCLKCNIHLLCASAIELHTVCPKSALWKCKLCKKTYHFRDKPHHKRQHELSKDIKTYNFTDNIYNKVLWKCCDCNAYLEELKFLEHRFQGCKETEMLEWCAICKANVLHLPSHKTHHSEKKTKSEFILIDDFFTTSRVKDIEDEDSTAPSKVTPNKQTGALPQSKKVNLKRKLPIDGPGSPKRAKISRNVTIFYCDTCGTFNKYNKCREYHVAKHCLSAKNYKRSHCSLCGLKFTSGTPLIRHKADHFKFKWKLKDYVFLNIDDGQPIFPPLPKFPACTRCNIHHVGSDHDCNAPKKTCTVCQDSFDQAAFKLHLMHHKYLRQPSFDDNGMDVLIQKYESLKSTWNIVYQCSLCMVATDSYDRAVEHCQNHLASASQSSTKNCEICSIHFDESSIKKHRELHTNSEISISSFNILTYEYTDLLTEKWFKLFASLSKVEMKQITSSSIYVTRSVKMNLILNGPPEYTIYKCESCKNYEDASRVYGHTHSCDGKSTAHSCTVCGIPFCSNNGLIRHQKIHASSNITANSYRIISFNAKTDKNFNAKLKNAKEDIDDRINDSQSVTSDSNVKKDKIKFYQCKKCKQCSISSFCVYRHICMSKSDFWACQKCPFITSIRWKNAHIRWHLENIDLTRKQIIIEPYSKFIKAEKVKSECTWYQCQKCKVLVKTTIHDCNAKDVTYTCSICDLKFYSRSYRQHEIEHRENKNLTRKDITLIPIGGPAKKSMTKEKPDMVTLFKCSCKLHFTSMKALKEHARVCSPDLVVSSENCSQCSLEFPANHLVEHLLSHHRTPGIKKFLIRSMPKDKTKTGPETPSEMKQKKMEMYSLNNSNYDTNLYKCWCGLYFLTPGSYFDHKLIATDHKAMKREECPECGFVFTRISLYRHKEVHHEIMGLRASDFVVQLRNELLVVPKDGHSASKHDGENYVYECVQCDTHYCHLSDAKLHYCLSKSEENCKVCGLKFSKHSLSLHETLHHEQHQYTLEDLNIFTFKKDLESVEIHYEDVNEDVVLVDNEKKRKRKFTGEKVENKKLYKCAVCGLHYIRSSTLKRHATGKHDEEKVECKGCGLAFTADELSSHKSVHHDSGNLKLKDFDIIVNSSVDLDTTNGIAETDLSVNLDSELEISKSMDSLLSQKSMVLYKCPKCDLSFLTTKGINKHVTDNHYTDGTFNCDQCGLKFNKLSFSKHNTVHQTNKYRSLEIISIHDLDLISSSEHNLNIGNKIYKCTVCELSFSCLTSLANHISVGDHGLKDIPKCTECGLMFTSKVLTKHIATHHELRHMRLEDFDIQTLDITSVSLDELNTNKVMPKDEETETSVGSCESVTGMVTPQSVSDVLDETETQYQKPELNERAVSAFDTSVTAAVVVKEEGTTISETATVLDNPNTLNNTSVDKDSDESAVSQSSDLDLSLNERNKKNGGLIKLYKCGQCKVFFLNQNSCYKHTLNHSVMDPKEYIECKLCSLQFRIMSLAVHIKKHHCKNFELSDVLVEEYQPKKKGQKAPKIEIYYAIDKVQSRLVSTTTDDDRVEAGKSTPDVTQSSTEEVMETVTDGICDALVNDDIPNSVPVEEINKTLNSDCAVDNFKDSNDVGNLTTVSEPTKDDNAIKENKSENENISTPNNDVADEPKNFDVILSERIPPETLDLEKDDNTSDVRLEKDASISNNEKFIKGPS